MAGETLRDEVCRALREKIVRGELPPGHSLGEVELARQLQVSRTPIREAIRHLQDEGFIEYMPHCGARVVLPTRTFLLEVFELREALEGMAARLAATRIETGSLVRLRDRFERLRQSVGAGNMEDVGDWLHDEMLAAAANQRLSRLMATYRMQVKWLQRIASDVPGRLGKAFREHDSILAGLESHDANWAESVARSHVRNTLEDLLKSFQEPPTGLSRRSRSKMAARSCEAAIEI